MVDFYIKGTKPQLDEIENKVLLNNTTSGNNLFNVSGYFVDLGYTDDAIILSVDEENIWESCFDDLKELNETEFNNELIISMRVIDESYKDFFIHDDFGFFTEDVVISSSGIFEDNFCEPFSVKDAIMMWCDIMDKEQGNRTDDEMISYINNYDYDDEDDTLKIYKFEKI
jgi:hypothetical protein